MSITSIIDQINRDADDLQRSSLKEDMDRARKGNRVVPVSRLDPRSKDWKRRVESLYGVRP